uniref:EGF-like domain-containing protein n=1 Tax=Echinostoma caproni TaxID=27848 RepID=A0A183B535_9TREM
LVCLNGGSCVKDGTKPVCSCTIGYTGRRCEHRDPCVTNPCHSHGRCISNNLGHFRCACESGWIGEDCTEDLDECIVDEHSPCAHDGICLNTPGSFVCQCPVGFTGPRCEEVVLECTAQPCRNGARCIEGMGSYRCECAPVYNAPDKIKSVRLSEKEHARKVSKQVDVSRKQGEERVAK